jgi:hypothetical protein
MKNTTTQSRGYLGPCGNGRTGNVLLAEKGTRDKCASSTQLPFHYAFVFVPASSIPAAVAKTTTKEREKSNDAVQEVRDGM